MDGGGAGVFVAGKRPWSVETTLDIALPCATQNEIEAADAEALVKAGVKLVAEGANMPSTSEAIDIYHKNGIVFGPAKVRLLMPPPLPCLVLWSSPLPCCVKFVPPTPLSLVLLLLRSSVMRLSRHFVCISPLFGTSFVDILCYASQSSMCRPVHSLLVLLVRTSVSR